MMTFKKNIDDRKVLVKRLEELTGVSARYTRVPRCAYEIGAYTVEIDGSLCVEEEIADRTVLAALLSEGLIWDEEGLIEADAEETDERGLAVSVSITKYNGAKLRNMVNLLYSRGTLINHAIGSGFYVSEELVEYLKDDSCTYTVKNFEKALEDFTLEHPGETHLKGFEITDGKVTLTGFPADIEGERIEAYAQLAQLMHRQALTQKRIQTRVANDDNEKYAMRIWLIRIGMKGDEYKNARRILLGDLSGQAAFRREEDAARFFEKEKKKRDAAKAAKAAKAAEKKEAETAKEPAQEALPEEAAQAVS